MKGQNKQLQENVQLPYSLHSRWERENRWTIKLFCLAKVYSTCTFTFAWLGRTQYQASSPWVLHISYPGNTTNHTCTYLDLLPVQLDQAKQMYIYRLILLSPISSTLEVHFQSNQTNAATGLESKITGYQLVRCLTEQLETLVWDQTTINELTSL